MFHDAALSRDELSKLGFLSFQGYRAPMSSAIPALLGGTPLRPQGPPTWPLDDPAVAEMANRALRDGAWGRYVGEYGDILRERLAALHDARHVRCCASGTAAVELALRGLGVGPGDEVVMSAYDFPANFKNILAVGARPVLLDIRPDDAQIHLDQLKEAASSRIKAVLVSHLHGGVVDMPRLRAVADEAGWGVIEDACQMPGAIIHGRPAGMWGDVAAISFGGSKLLTAGRGGCVLTNRNDVAQRIRLHVERGNDLSPLSEIQAALLIPQLEQLAARRDRRTASVARLREGIAGFPALRPFAPPAASDAGTQADYYKVAFWYDAAALGGLPRETFAAAVRAEGVALWPAFQGLHRIHSAKRFRAPGPLVQASAADEQLLVLHHPVLLRPAGEIDQVVEAMEKVAGRAGELRDVSIPSRTE